MKRLSLYFTQEKKLQLVENQVPDLEMGQVLVRALVSAISPGTEMLIYRGQFPENMVQDAVISALQAPFVYPFKYGYSMVGQVCELGPGVSKEWRDQRVFAFWPHESFFTTTPDHLIPLPEDLDPEEAVFLPNMETAVNFLMDGQPVIGERVVVFGQGIVGLLTTALLAGFPLASLVTLDRFPFRRAAGLELGAAASVDPSTPDADLLVKENLGGPADLTFEVSGSPAALDQAIAITGFSGRVVIGSWYGEKPSDLHLGRHFHRARLRLISSQVSSLSPELTGRWDKARRMDVAWRALREIHPAQFITHRFPLAQADQAYSLIDHDPGSTIQVILQYPP